MDDRRAAGDHLDVFDYWRILLEHRWLAAGSLIGCLVVGIVVTLLTPPTYVAAATLQIDRESARVVSAESQTPSDNLAGGEEFFQTQYGLMRSRSLAARVAASLGLARDDAFVEAMTGRPPRRGTRDRKVIQLLRDHLDVAPARGSRLVSMTFASPDAPLSARIANAFAESFIAAGLDRQVESSSYARGFLERRLGQVKSKLEDSERELVAYAAGQQIINLAGGQANNPDAQPSLAGASLEALNGALAAATADRIHAEERWRQAEKPGASMDEALLNPTVQQISQERARLMAEYQDKLEIYKPDYPDMRRLEARIDETNRQLRSQTAGIRASLETQYQVALTSERSLTAQVETLKTKVLDLRGRGIRYAILQREADTNRTLYAGLLQRYKEIGVAGGLAANNISIVDRAVAPAAPSRPDPVANLALAALAGMVLGIGLAFAREGLDQAIRAPADIDDALGLAVLGLAPSLRKGLAPREALADMRSPLAESYHSLRSALQFSTTDGFPRTLLVTSAAPGGGKSTTALAIGQSLARLGFRALIVDADLRNPSLHALLGADTRVGLSNVLTGAASLNEAAQATDQPNLFIVTSGPLPPNPAELLAGARMKQLIAEAGLMVDMVIFDGPPIMGLADAPVIGAAVAGALLIVEAGRTTRAQIKAAVQRLAIGKVHVLGAFLTRCAPCPETYGYGYGRDDEASAEIGLVGLRAMVARARRAVAA